MSMQELYNGLQGGAWAETNPSKCPCRGRGWLLSDFDTWHRCPVHGGGVPHPECLLEGEGETDFDWEAHSLRVDREAFARFRKVAMDNGVRSKRGFRTLCERKLGDKDNPSPVDWIDAAEAVAEDFYRARCEREAKAAGYSCHLEARWAQDAAMEARERGGW